MAELRMPSLGADMEAGTLVAWRCALGDRIRRGDIVAEVETEKGIIEVEAFESGIVEELLVPQGTRVMVGAALARLGEGAVAARPTLAPPTAITQPAPVLPIAAPTMPISLPAIEPAAPSRAPTAPPQPAASAALLAQFPPSVRLHAREEGVDPFVILARRFQLAAPAPRVASEPAVERARIAPRARKRAAELGIDAVTLVGTGPDGSITTDDVERAARARSVAPPAAERPPSAEEQPPAPAGHPPTAADRQTAMRRAIAASMERSNREIPHYYVATTIDLSLALAWLAAANADRRAESRLLPAVLLLKATARALRQIPELNATWRDGALHPIDRVHLGVAVSLRGGGLVAPAIHDADRLGLDELMKSLGDVVARARAGRLRSSEFVDATCTVTSLGERGVETVMPLIMPPQVAMIGFGKIVEVPIAVEGRAEIRPVVHATLAGDHRATDGHRGAAFLAALAALLTRPEAL